MVIDLTDKNFDAEVTKSSIPVVIDFWAPWCGPCRVFSPTIESVSKEYEGKVKFAKLNTDDYGEIASRYNIMNIPSVLLFKKGRVISASAGAVPKETLRKWIEQNM